MNDVAQAAGEILYEVKDGIGRVTFNRPQARNAMLFSMYQRVVEICAEAEQTGLRALIFTGAGDKAFASGTDISQFRAFKTAQDAMDYEKRISGVLDALERCQVPTIAAVAGACVGGGLGIAGCCDIRIATANARFGLPIARTLGNTLSSGATARMAALIGPARLKEIIFTARLIGAEEAKAIGLCSEVLPDHDALQARADELARTIASHAPLTLRATKEALRRLGEINRKENEDLIKLCYMSADFREGMEAFLNKRAPAWQGR